MALPEWARRALVSASPESEYGQWLAGMAEPLRKRWRDIQADKWGCLIGMRPTAMGTMMKP